MAILNLDPAPRDPIERLVWLGGVKEAAERELEDEFRVTYYNARMSGRIDQALALRLHSSKRVMAFTRAENERRGRVIRSWGDGR